MGGKSSREYQKNWRETHRESVQKSQAKYLAKIRVLPGYKERLKLRGRRWRAEHPEQSRAKVKKYQETHKEQLRQHYKEVGKKLKLEILTFYGNGKCACVQCGENRIDCLSIDHINNDGYAHRKRVGNGGRMYDWLKKNNFPLGFQTLCMNDQFLKRAD